MLVQRRALGTPAGEVEIDWPLAWRLPLVGETITGPGFSSFIEMIGWDLVRGVPKVYLR